MRSLELSEHVNSLLETGLVRLVLLALCTCDCHALILVYSLTFSDFCLCHWITLLVCSCPVLIIAQLPGLCPDLDHTLCPCLVLFRHSFQEYVLVGRAYLHHCAAYSGVFFLSWAGFTFSNNQLD